MIKVRGITVVLSGGDRETYEPRERCYLSHDISPVGVLRIYEHILSAVVEQSTLIHSFAPGVWLAAHRTGN